MLLDPYVLTVTALTPSYVVYFGMDVNQHDQLSESKVTQQQYENSWRDLRVGVLEPIPVISN